VVSKQPLAESRTTLGSQISDQGMRRGTLDTSGPLDDDGRFAYRLNVIGEGGDTFRDHVETERYGVTPVLSWQVNDRTKITFEGDFMRNNAPLDRGLTRYPTQRGVASRDTFFGEKDVGKLHNDNNMGQVRKSSTAPWPAMASRPMALRLTAAPWGATSTTASWSGVTATTS
jgi:iron complex outermembrane receptor protein